MTRDPSAEPESEAAPRVARSGRSGAELVDARAERRARVVAKRRERLGLEPTGDEPPPAPRRTEADRLRRLGNETELLRNKLFQLHAALIARGTLAVGEVGAAGGDVVPEERSLGGHDRVVLAFGGMASRLQMPPSEFARTFAARRADLFFYKDLQQCWYQRGLLGLTRDVPSTGEYIRRSVAGYGQVHTVGTSAGGFGAILFGVLANANRIVAFSPQTTINERVFRRFASTDSRQADIDLRNKYLDLSRVLDETPFEGRIELYYGVKNDADRFAAEYLARFPCVTLRPVDTDSHGSAQHLRDNGAFEEVFAFLD